MRTESFGILAESTGQAGLTLVELLIAVLVMSIVVALGIPSFERATARRALTSSANDFATALNLARASALKARQNVRVCPTDNPRASSPSCDTGASPNYANGFIVYVDHDQSGTLTTNNDEIVHIGMAMDHRVTSLQIPAIFGSEIVFNPNGAVSVGATGEGDKFRLCSDVGNVPARLVTISAVGRVFAGKDTAPCSTS